MAYRLSQCSRGWCAVWIAPLPETRLLVPICLELPMRRHVTTYVACSLLIYRNAKRRDLAHHHEHSCSRRAQWSLKSCAKNTATSRSCSSFLSGNWVCSLVGVDLTTRSSTRLLLISRSIRTSTIIPSRIWYSRS